jgi:glycosyltransferase involved in cell wall biosynthesis
MFPVQKEADTSQACRVLWVGRLLNLKRVDTIVRAIGENANLKRVDDSLPKITLDVYGIGPEECRLKKMAKKWGDAIRFYPPVSIDMVRKLMHEHDMYVLASDAHEGWGAVVSEALVEGMRVFATYESGSGATMLPDECLFRAGDWRRLACLLRGAASESTKVQGIGAWSVAEGVERMLAAIKLSA